MQGNKKVSLNSEWFNMIELEKLALAGLPKKRNKIVTKALKEDWTRRPRNKQGGGYEYHIDSLPVPARMDLLTRMGSNYSVEADLQQAQQDLKPAKKTQTKSDAQLEFKDLTTVVNQPTQPAIVVTTEPIINHKYQQYVSKALSLNKKEADIFKKRIKTAKVKELILNKINFLKAGKDFKNASLTYVDYYNKGFETDLIDNESFYTYIKSLSLRNLIRWKQATNADDLLPKDYKHQSLVEQNSNLKNFMVQQLINNPYTPAKLSHQILIK